MFHFFIYLFDSFLQFFAGATVVLLTFLKNSTRFYKEKLLSVFPKSANV